MISHSLPLVLSIFSFWMQTNWVYDSQGNEHEKARRKRKKKWMRREIAEQISTYIRNYCVKISFLFAAKQRNEINECVVKYLESLPPLPPTYSECYIDQKIAAQRETIWIERKFAKKTRETKTEWINMGEQLNAS